MSIKIDRCLVEGNIGKERHKGLKKVGVSEEKIKGHLNKALHNFKAMMLFKKEGFSDWSASAAFYCLYHALLAILAKKGYESRNQNCTFIMIEEMINNKELDITIAELKEIFDKDVTSDIEHSNKLLDIRENMQYSIKTSLEGEEFLSLKERTKNLFDKIRREVER